jgi:phosphinothricin acetyltransferase
MGGSEMLVRAAVIEDTEAIASIYNEGIHDRIATFETRLRTPEDIQSWLSVSDQYPMVVVERDGAVIGFARTDRYRDRACYRHIAEYSVYVARRARQLGAGRAALSALVVAASTAGFRKLVSRIFVENTASRRLAIAEQFREVGIYQHHGQVDGVWRDVVIVERLLPPSL